MAGPQKKIIAPWTEQQVRDLNDWQAGNRLELVVCGAEHHLGWLPKLVATESGWVCPEVECNYQQDWAYLFMGMSDHMVNWGVECEGCASLLDRCYEADMRAEAAEAKVAELTDQILEGRW